MPSWTAHLEQRVPVFSSADHPVGFFKCARDWFFYQHVNASFE